MTDVLIVDDDGSMRDVLEAVLDGLGYSVATCADGAEALEWLAKNEPPRLVMLDWMMPRCNGAEFRRRQLQDVRIAGIPVVLLTADMRIDRKQAELRAETYLQKPIALATLRDLMTRYVARESTSTGAAS
jgi:CheY-like chemotaxis protein